MNIIIDQEQKHLCSKIFFLIKKKFEAGFYNVHRSEKKANKK